MNLCASKKTHRNRGFGDCLTLHNSVEFKYERRTGWGDCFFIFKQIHIFGVFKVMIYSLRGTVQEINPSYAVIETGGVGYFVGISLQTYEKLSLGKEAFLWVQQIIREDAHLLFGFYTAIEKSLFNLLISVNGVGPVSALIMLSSLSFQEISSAILSRNSGVLQKVKGIGAKTAERIIIDLRDKIQKLEIDSDENLLSVNNKVKNEALSALEVLGISKKISEKLAEKFLKQSPDLPVEDLVKQILKNL